MYVVCELFRDRTTMLVGTSSIHEVNMLSLRVKKRSTYFSRGDKRSTYSSSRGTLLSSIGSFHKQQAKLPGVITDELMIDLLLLCEA